jgi:anti-sigma factor RsiW
MPVWRRTTPCERAAEWISLDLDGELSDRDRAALARHVGHCPACARLLATTAAITSLLRTSPLEPPPRPIVVPAPAHRWGAIPRRGAASAVAIACALAAALALVAYPRSPSRAPTPVLASATLIQRLEFARAEVARTDLQPSSAGQTTVSLPTRPSLACSLGCWSSEYFG